MAQTTTTFASFARHRRHGGTLRRSGRCYQQTWKRTGWKVEVENLRGAAFRNNGRSEEREDNTSTSVDFPDVERSNGQDEKTMWNNVEEKIVQVGDSLDEASGRIEDSGLWVKFIAVILPLWVFAIYYELYVVGGASP